MGHPEPDELLAFVEGRLEAPAHRDVERHLDGCSACQELVAGVAGAFLSSVTLGVTTDPEGSTAVALPEIGSKLGRFHLLEEIGRGAMGAVFAAYDPDLDRRVALKVLLRSDTDDKAQARLLREAQAMARLSHPNVITVHEAQLVDGRLYISMEYVTGGTLRAWIARGSHPWPEVLSVFVPMGQGLEAAHKAGLVHRDVKPENVLLGEEGGERRVRVTDFGLARATEVDTRDEELPVAAEPTLHELTAAGTLMGTPAYMSPEQFRGERAGARSDQFSYCVTLYEALYGQRPFEGESLTALAAAVMSGDRRDPPPDRNVPRWLRQVLARGLQREPALRFDSMTELLHELDRGQSRPPVSRAALVGGATLVALAATTAIWVATREPACSGAEGELAGVWDAPAQLRVQEALLSADVPYAETTWRRVQDGLDRYAQAWAQSYVDACEATVLRKVQSQHTLDARMRCLGRRKDRLRSVVELLKSPDPAVAENAVRAVEDLPGLAVCSDVELVARSLPPPDDPDVRRAVEAGRREAAEVDGLRTAGKYEEAVRLGRELLDDAEALGYDPFVAEADLALGRALEQAGEFEEAVAKLDHAVWIGRASGHDEVVLQASIALVPAIEQHTGTTADALAWARRAWAEVERGGDDPRLRADLMVAEANARREAGDLEKSRALLQSAVTLRREQFGSEHPETARALCDLGKVFEAIGQFDDALEVNEDALRIYETALGPDHPTVAYTLMSLAYVHAEEFHQDKALELEQRALSIFEASLQPDHPRIATVCANLANTLMMLGRIDEGIAMAQRSIDLYDSRLGPDHVEIVTSLLIQGQSLVYLERGAEALQKVRRAIAILEAAQADKPNPERLGQAQLVLSKIAIADGKVEEAVAAGKEYLRINEERTGPDSEAAAQARLNLGTIYGLGRRYDEARTELELALPILEDAHGPEHPFVSLSVNNLSAVYRELGMHEQAIEFALRAIELRQTRADSPVGSLGQGHFNLAAAYATAGRTDEAISHYEISLDHYSRAARLDPTDLADAQLGLGEAILERDRRRGRTLLKHARAHYVTLETSEAADLVREIDRLLR